MGRTSSHGPAGIGDSLGSANASPDCCDVGTQSRVSVAVIVRVVVLNQVSVKASWKPSKTQLGVGESSERAVKAKQ